MNRIVATVPAQTLRRTSYVTAVVKLANGTRALIVTEAGASASGINGKLLDKLEAALDTPIIGATDTVAGQGTWHMNDAEQQLLRTLYPPNGARGALKGATLKAVVANRDTCASCTHFLKQQGLVVDGAQAVAP